MGDSEVLVLAGPPCAGKSTLGRMLADSAREREVYLEVDTLFSLLLPRSDRSKQDRILAYDAAHALARTLIVHQHTAILECTYARREQRASLLEAMSTLPFCALKVVEFVISPEEAVQRFRKRREATDLDETSLRERVENFPYWDGALRIDSSAADPRALADEVATWRQGGSPPADWIEWVEVGRSWS
ncbi:ATP-binding protein [Nocardioides sp. BGMRC 2183]|nr:ATP-binding protein [Nocardioides sp. BGMRC 2183]